MAIVKASELKKLVKEGGKKCGKDFIAAFEHQVELKLQQCIKEHNGGRRVLDIGVCTLIFGGAK